MADISFARRGGRARLVVAVLAVVAVTVVVVAVLVSGEEPAPVVEAEPPPEPEPEPEPDPPPPVEGDLEVAGTVDLSTADTGLYQPHDEANQPVPVDTHAVDAFADDLRRWLDDGLTQLHRTGDVGAFAPDLVGPQELLALGTPDRPIAGASYLATIGVRGVPEWAEVEVTVTRDDGSTTVVLVVTAEATPTLVAAGEPTTPPVPDEHDEEADDGEAGP